MHELLIGVGSGSHRSQLESFLRTCRAEPRVVDECTIAVDLDRDGCPALATLVRELDDWRCSSHAGEVALELGGEVRILRAET
jgi:hypothetical protein